MATRPFVLLSKKPPRVASGGVIRSFVAGELHVHADSVAIGKPAMEAAQGNRVKNLWTNRTNTECLTIPLIRKEHHDHDADGR